MKTIKLGPKHHEGELALVAACEETEKASTSVFEAIARLQKVKSVINDMQYWAKLGTRSEPFCESESISMRRLHMAAWHSASLAFLARHEEVRRLAAAMLSGPRAQAHGYLMSCVFTAEWAVAYRARNIVAADQLAQRVERETKRGRDLIENYKYGDQAARALEQLFEINFDGRPGCGYKRECKPGEQLSSYAGPPISDDMLYVPFDFAQFSVEAEELFEQAASKDPWQACDWDACYEVFVALPQVLESLQQAFKQMRAFKGVLNEDTFGQRLQKVLKKPADLEVVVAEQHARRCELAALKTEVEVRTQDLHRQARRIGYLISAYTITVKMALWHPQRLVMMNNALVLTQAGRTIDKWFDVVKAEFAEHADLYKVADEALLATVRGEEPTPQEYVS